MKVIAVIVCVAYLAVLAQGLADEYKQKLKTSHEECQSNPDTHVDEELIGKLRKGEEVDKDKVLAHSLCMNKKLGLQKENGDVDKEGLKEALSKGITDETKLNEVVDKCATPKGTPLETAEKLMKCFHKHVGRLLHEHDNHDGHGGRHGHHGGHGSHGHHDD